MCGQLLYIELYLDVDEFFNTCFSKKRFMVIVKFPERQFFSSVKASYWWNDVPQRTITGVNLSAQNLTDVKSRSSKKNNLDPEKVGGKNLFYRGEVSKSSFKNYDIFLFWVVPLKSTNQVVPWQKEKNVLKSVSRDKSQR